MKYGKYSRAKFANFVYICITRGKVTIRVRVRVFVASSAQKCMLTFSVHNTNIYKILKTSQRYIFRILRHFAIPNFAILLILSSSF